MIYKRILAMAAIVGAIASCTLKEPVIQVSQSTASDQEVTLFASLDEPETRTERVNTKVYWSPGDQISLFYGSGTDGGSCFTAQNTELSKTANFTGTIGVITAGNEVSADGTYFWAVYPYNSTASCDGTSITTVLPSAQVAKADSFADDLFPTIGRSRGLRMGFYNICGGVTFTVSEEGMTSVTLEGHNNEVLAGTLTVGFDAEGHPAVTNIADGSKTVTVTAPSGTYFELGKTYYIVIVPTVFQNGFTLTFRKGYNQAVHDRAKKTTINRGSFGALTTPDKDLEWAMPPYITIPDPNFSAYMLANFDTNGNGFLDLAEAQAVTTIDVNTDNIESLEGIAYCTNLQSLTCKGSWSNSKAQGKLSSLDVRHNSKLTYLSCSQNQLTGLYLDCCAQLSTLYCYRNQLIALDVSKNTALTTLSCYSNQITALDVSKNTALKDLLCYSNQLTSLDVSKNTSLTYLSCYSNQIAALDVSKNTALTSLDCPNNQLTSLDVSKNTSLTHLYCSNNQLTSLDVSKNTALTALYCYRNQLPSLDVSKNTSLTYLSCYSNQIAALDVSKNTALTQLSCYSNQLTSLDVSKNTALTYFRCYNNQLTSLNLSTNTELKAVYCYGNLLATLNVSTNTKLTTLDCAPMNDASGNNLLSFLYIAQDQSIPNVTPNRNANYVPADTIITLSPNSGGNEGTGDDPL